MAIEKLTPLNHYSMTALPSVYDEEALTALELAGRTATKMNETITLLLEECKEQNLTIEEAVRYMKDKLDDTMYQLVLQLANKGELDLILETNFEAIKKHILPCANVMEFGAIGDGVTDDTNAIKEAIASSNDIYFPAGKYLITDTIVIDSFKHLYGDGAEKTTITCVENKFMFEIRTNYANRPVIEKLRFTAGVDNNTSFMKVATGKWGSSVILRDFRIVGFSGTLFRFESSFQSLIQNGTIMTQAGSVFTTFDGTSTTNNFSNCNHFENVYYTYHPDHKTTNIPVMFQLFNVRQLTFTNCQLEHCDLLFKVRDIVQGLVLNGCWLEYVGALFDYRESADNALKPIFNDCRRVYSNVYDVTKPRIDYIEGDKNIQVHNGSNRSPIDLRDTEEVVLDRKVVFNENDTYSQYWIPYQLSTHELMVKLPVNTYTVEVTDSVSATFNLKNIMNYGQVFGYYDVTALCYYADASGAVFKKRIHSYRSQYFGTDTVKEYSSGWGEEKDTTGAITMDNSTGVVTFSNSKAVKKIVLMVEFHLNHAKGVI